MCFSGKCLCGAGWKGDDCTTPNKRPCFNMGPDKRDAGITERHWVHTRCSGVAPPHTQHQTRLRTCTCTRIHINQTHIHTHMHTPSPGLCDDDIGMCYCPPETKFGRQFKPDAKPGEPPLNRGRPMFWCNPNNVRLVVDGLHGIILYLSMASTSAIGNYFMCM